MYDKECDSSDTAQLPASRRIERETFTQCFGTCCHLFLPLQRWLGTITLLVSTLTPARTQAAFAVTIAAASVGNAGSVRIHAGIASQNRAPYARIGIHKYIDLVTSIRSGTREMY